MRQHSLRGWQRLSVLGAIGMDGFMAAMSIEVAHRQRYLCGLSRAGAAAGVAQA
jgi:hypothetical protein